ncbi:Aste57867_22169 [Aphanomyces stellatus]|uniref:Aste57867_22169 protein n=1 Tax=Aphanomyces stellatus TaxID=120398 RepID=A0A485LK62_9STRA|nr:hypothetical protein As57867_022100 [Aphanomyces stellatus]VFT98836.1 Aste57867_22169 [Aphanomyces stellatus]
MIPRTMSMDLFAAAAVVVAVALAVVVFRSSQPRLDLKQKHVVITGAACGIGRGLAIAFANAGAIVSLMDINHAGLKEVAAAIDRPTAVHVCPCDISDPVFVQISLPCISHPFHSQVAAALATLKAAAAQPVDILINNAGIVHGKSILELTHADVQKTFEVNTLSHFNTVRSVLPHMLERRRGLIVTVSSVMGLNGAARLTDYCASKSALVGFHESLRLELHDSGVRTLLVCPMAVASGMFHGIHQVKTLWHRVLHTFLLPMVSVDDVVATMMDAIQDPHRHELITCTPSWRRHVLPWVIRGVRILPVALMDLILGLGGARDGMDTFVGHPTR